MKLSYSLKNSDLNFFTDCSTSLGIEYVMDGILNDDYSYILSHFSLEYVNEKRAAFHFSTASHKNTICVVFDARTGKHAEAYYRVESNKPVNKSTAVRSFQEKGWTLVDDIDEDGQMIMSDQDRRNEEGRFVTDLRNGMVSGVDFNLSIQERDKSNYAYSYYPRVETDSRRCLELVMRFPQYAESLRKIAMQKLDESAEIVVPSKMRVFQYPDTTFHKSSDYYDLCLRNYTQALLLIITVCRGLEGTAPQVVIERREVKKPRAERAPRKPRAPRAQRSE